MVPLGILDRPGDFVRAHGIGLLCERCRSVDSIFVQGIWEGMVIAILVLSLVGGLRWIDSRFTNVIVVDRLANRETMLGVDGKTAVMLFFWLLGS